MQWAVGPFVMLSIAEFDTYSQYFPGGSRSAPVAEGGFHSGNKSLHEWLVLGVRGVFDPQSRTVIRVDDSHRNDWNE